MKLLNDTAGTVAFLVTRGRPGEVFVTWILKSTCALVPGGPVRPHEEPLFPSGDEPYPDAEGSVRYPSDFSPFKPKADLLLVGSCHPPGGKPVASCKVKFRVGSWSKSLAVIGTRGWRKGFLVGSASPPEAFASMPITYSNAFGGPEYPRNPLGKGRSEAVESGGSRGPGRRLPNVEFLDRLVVDPDKDHEPAGFGPIPPAWPQRMALVGTYDKKWLRERWPGPPEDFQWTYFNSAPADQQLPAHLRGDEEIGLENLRPDQPHFQTRLPGVRNRCFLQESGKDRGTFREVPLNLDTLWVDAEGQRVVLVWRGRTPVRSLKLEEIEAAWFVEEPLGKSVPAESYRKELPRRLAPSEPPPAAPPEGKTPEQEEFEAKFKGLDKAFAELGKKVKEVEAQAAQHSQAAQDMVASLGYASRVVPPSAPMGEAQAIEHYIAQLEKIRAANPVAAQKIPAIQLPPLEVKEIPEEPAAAEEPDWTRERVLSNAAAGGSFAGQDLQDLDLSGLALSGLDFHGALLSRTKLSGARLAGANLAEADLSGADLTGCDLSGARLERADLSAAILSGAKLPKALLTDADGYQARLDGADLSGALAVRAGFAEADLSRVVAAGADFTAADLFASILSKADFAGATLRNASIEKARGSGANWRGADLTGLQAGEAADLSGGRFQEVKAPGSTWECARLAKADFSRAALSRANFASANLAQAVFERADLRHARFDGADLQGANLSGANLFRGSFEAGTLRSAILRGANLFEVEFLDADDKGADYRGAYLKRTKKAGAE